MVSALIALPLVLALFGLMTLGSVLLAKFLLKGSVRSVRVLLASIAPPIALMVPTLLVNMTEGSEELFDLIIAFTVGGGSLSVVFCWPVAHFATKRLDRLTEFSTETFS